MYSRYTPDGQGGFARQQVAEPPVSPGTPEPPPMPFSEAPESPRPPAGPGPPGGPAPHRPVPSHQGPPPHRPGPVFSGSFPGPGSPPDTLAALLRRFDPEELLILAILVLALKQDGAGKRTIWMAAALYLLLGGTEEKETMKL